MINGIQKLLVRTNGSAYILFVLDWRTNDSYFIVERYGSETRCQTLLEARKCFGETFESRKGTTKEKNNGEKQ